jgi:hypothetical protein
VPGTWRRRGGASHGRSRRNGRCGWQISIDPFLLAWQEDRPTSCCVSQRWLLSTIVYFFSASQTDNVSQEFERAFQTWDKQMTRMMMTKPLSGTLCARLLFFST